MAHGVLVILLSAAVFLVRAAALMLGPLLVTLAAAFQTSVSAAGQLAAAINISWAVTALFVGPVSDTYGRRRVGLTGLFVMGAAILGSILAWDYWALLACRLLTGVGAAMIPPNSMALIADHFPPAERGRPIGIVLSASFLGPVVAIPLVALLADLGGWRAPFGVVGGLTLVLWICQWRWLPRHRPAATRAIAFRARFAALGRRAGIWNVLVANALYQTAAFALFTYLATFLIRSYGVRQGETALPLAVALLGAMVGSLLGGTVAGRAWRIGGVALTLLGGGIFVGAAFMAASSLWLTVFLAASGALLLAVFEPVTWALVAELAGESRATANGMLATTNQLGATIGASVGGLALAFGGFAVVGMLCLGAAVVSALTIGVKVPGTGAVRIQSAET